jgi:hypothetical protein
MVVPRRVRSPEHVTFAEGVVEALREDDVAKRVYREGRYR